MPLNASVIGREGRMGGEIHITCSGGKQVQYGGVASLLNIGMSYITYLSRGTKTTTKTK